MFETKELELDGKKFHGLRADLPKAPLVALIATNGYIMCGYLNIESAEKLGQAAAIVRGVNNFDDMLNGKVVAATSQARKLGVAEGMLGRDAIKKLV